MTPNALLQILLYLLVLLALVQPLGWFMARVYEGKPCGLDRVLGPVERLPYRLCGVRADEEMDRLVQANVIATSGRAVEAAGMSMCCSWIRRGPSPSATAKHRSSPRWTAPRPGTRRRGPARVAGG